MSPVDAVTLKQAARILGCGTSTVRRHVLAGRLASHGDRYEHRKLSQADVEALAAMIYPWRLHVHEPDSHWVTGQGAAALMGVSRSRLRQLADADRVPFLRARDGVRLYRRAQLETVARSRGAGSHGD